MSEERTPEQILVRREKLRELEISGVSPFGERFERNTTSADLIRKYGERSRESLTQDPESGIRIAGRIMTKRGKGKAGFAHIMDQHGQIQIYVRKDDVGDDAFALFDKADLGDIVGVEGSMMKTKMGELTVKVEHYIHLAKALRPLPEKFHGLKDIEERYRRRYLDLMTNEDVRETFILRSTILSTIREFLNAKGYLEVETPILHPIAGGGAARPFTTHHNTLDMQFYLRIACELYLKRLIVGGFEAVYEFARTFRNEGMSIKHNPEFTMLELYEAYGDMQTMMTLTEDLFTTLAQRVLKADELPYGDHVISLKKPFKTASMASLVKDSLGIDFEDPDMTYETAVAFAEEKGLDIPAHASGVGHIMFMLFEHFVENDIIQPTFVTHHPVETSPLAKKSADPRFTERFELIIAGREYANAFSELNDPIDQRERFEAQIAEKRLGNIEAPAEMDEDFIEALEHGMPPTGGLGIGIDRLIMLLSDSRSIRDVILFPHMRHRS